MAISKISTDASEISYTNRDYQSILSDLYNAIPMLTDKWNPEEETDPGIVLVKLMAMLGDMLSYNLDKKMLEMFPMTVQERINAYQIFSLTGYKMYWYKSAKCDVTLYNNSDYSAALPRFIEVSSSNIDPNGKTNYVVLNIDNQSLPAQYLLNGDRVTPGNITLPAIEGKLVAPSTNRDIVNPSLYEDWHTPYNFNVYYTEIVDNCYYLHNVNVDQDHIYLVSSDATNPTKYNEWTLVDDIDLETSTKYCFEFNSDSGTPYIRLNSEWNKDGNVNFKLFYITSNGSAGNISENVLSSVDTNIYGLIMQSPQNSGYIIINDYVNISNTVSSQGYNPESITSARRSYKSFRNTINTLITLDDFTNFTNRNEYVIKSKAVDLLTDPNLGGVSNQLHDFQVRIYTLVDDSVRSFADIKSDILSEINQCKIALDDVDLVQINPDSSQHTDIDNNYGLYYWQPVGVIHLTKPMPSDIADDIMSTVNQALKDAFSQYNLDFNEIPNYIDVVEKITNSSSYINYVNLNALEYYSNPDMQQANQVDENIITGDITIKLDIEDIDSTVITVDLFEDLPSTSRITPGSVVIKVDNDILCDDNMGAIISYKPNVLASNGTINYTTGALSFTLDNLPNLGIEINFKLNRINLCNYIGDLTGTLYIAPEYLK